MDKIIEIKGRYSIHTLKQLTPVKGSESKTYKLVLGEDDSIIRIGYTEDNKFFIDPPGGPCMVVGGTLKNHVIKSIDYSYELSSYIITFE
jgi:hypothetical protein